MKFSKKCISVVFSAIFAFSAVTFQPITFAFTLGSNRFSFKIVDENEKTAILTKIPARGPTSLQDPIDGYSMIEVADNSSSYKQIKDRHMKDRIGTIAMMVALLPTFIVPLFIGASMEHKNTFTTEISYTGPAITSVNLPNCVKVGTASFVFCNKLKTIDLPKCESLAKGSLYGCTSLTRLNIPKCERIDAIFDDTDNRFNAVTYRQLHYPIQRYRHCECSAFKELNAPGCIEVAANSFSDFPGLKTVNLHSCKTIGGQAFYNCKSLTTLDLTNCEKINTRPLSAWGETVYIGAFENCEKLKGVDTPNLTFADTACFKNCKALKSIDLSKCEEIKQSCCENCISLTKVLLDSAKKIQNYAFKNCNSLQDVSATNVVSIGEGAFYNTDLKRIDLLNCRSVGKDAFKDCKTLEAFDSLNLTSIGESAFENDKNLEEIQLPNCKVVAKNAFKSCETLIAFNSPNLTSIGESAFENDKNLEEIQLPNCKVIAKNAFKNCYKLKKITIPKSCKLEENSLPYDLLIDQKLEIVRI